MTVTDVAAGAQVSAATPRRRRPRSAMRRQERRWGLAFVAPTMIGIAILYVGPMVVSLGMSLTRWSTFEEPTFVGLENHVRVWTDPAVWRATLNNLVYTAIVLLGVPVAVFFAGLLARPGLRFTRVYRALFFLPYVAMPTAIAMVWRMIFNRDFGIVNSAMGALGLPRPAWLTTEWLALIVVALVALWMSIGFKLVILLAGLQSIPPELYEAASLDGASSWRQFWHVTVPLLTPSIFFLTVTTAIGGFQVFDLVYVLLGQSNPVINESQSLVYLFYPAAFPADDKGYASALALLVLLFVGVCTAVQFRVQKWWVHYD